MSNVEGEEPDGSEFMPLLLGGDGGGDGSVPVPRPRDVGKPFDPDPIRELNRTVLAIGSFALFSITVIGLLVAVMCGRPWSELGDAAAVLLPAVSAVTATSLAFFFAIEKKRRR